MVDSPDADLATDPEGTAASVRLAPEAYLRPPPPAMVHSSAWDFYTLETVLTEELVRVRPMDGIRRIRIPHGFQGAVEVTLPSRGPYTLVLNAEPIHLHLVVAESNTDIALEIDPAPELRSASLGVDVIPEYRNAPQGKALIEIRSADESTDLPVTNVTLWPGHSLVARPTDIWVSRVALTFAEPPLAFAGEGFVGEQPSPVGLIHHEAELVLCHSMIGVASSHLTNNPAARVNRLSVVRVLRSQPWFRFKFPCNTKRLVLGPATSVLAVEAVFHDLIELGAASRLSLAPGSTARRVVTSDLDYDGAPNAVDFPPRVDVVPRSIGGGPGLPRIGEMVGPVKLQLVAERPAGEPKGLPAEVLVVGRLSDCRVTAPGYEYRYVDPPTLRLGARSIAERVAFDAAPNPRSEIESSNIVGLHMDDNSSVYEAKGVVAIRCARGATVHGDEVGGLKIERLCPRRASEGESDEATLEPSSILSDGSFKDVAVVLHSAMGQACLAAAKASKSFDAHYRTWTTSNSPLKITDETALKYAPFRAVLPTGSADLDPAGQQRSVGLAILSEVTRDKARSGTTRAGVAISTLQKRQESVAFYPERLLLSAGRLVGFGYRIGRPLLLLLLTSIVVAASAMGDRGFDPTWHGLGNLIAGTANVLVEPSALLRGLSAESWLQSEVGDGNLLAVTVARVLLSLPLGFAVSGIVKRARVQ